MAIKYLNDIDLNNNELQNAVIQNVGGIPTGAEQGQIWFDTRTTHEGVWVMLSNSRVKRLLTSAFEEAGLVTGSSNWSPSDTITGLELLFKAGSNVSITKVSDSISGYDAYQISATNTTYSVGTPQELAAGTSTNPNVWQPKTLHDYISGVIGAVDAMRFKGTVGTGGTVTTLPTTGVKVGDTYMVNSAGTYAGQTCEVGDLIIATATTPTWTVAQTNINGAITSLSNGTGISISGSGASRTIGHSNSVTAGTAGTSSATSGTNTLAIPYVTYDAQGHITASGTHTHTISNATTSAPGLMSASDKGMLQTLQTYATRSVVVTNPTLTSQNGICEWTVLLDMPLNFASVTIYDLDTLKQVMAEVIFDNNYQYTIKFISSANIAAEKYSATITGVYQT